MTNLIRSYGKIYQHDHSQAQGLYKHNCLVQEKVDGSQFSFRVVDNQLYMRSKNVPIYPGNVDKLFRPAVETVQRLFDEGLLDGQDMVGHEGATYRCETLCKPKHNTIEYDRVPRGNLVLFDIDVGNQLLLDIHAVKKYAQLLGIDVTPTLPIWNFSDEKSFTTLSFIIKDTESFLGGAKIEGAVIKPIDTADYIFDPAGKIVMAKMISEGFAERNSEVWKAKEGSKNHHQSVLVNLAKSIGTERRYQKTVERLRDDGNYTNSVKDIGPAMKVLSIDIGIEEQEFIKEALWKTHKSGIIKAAVKGFPEWYKGLLESDTSENDS